MATDLVMQASSWNKAQRLGLGALTVPPVIMTWSVPLFALIWPQQGAFHLGVLGTSYVYLPVMTVFLLMLYVPLVYNNKAIKAATRRCWLLGFIVFGFISVPVYWYKHVLKAPYAAT